MNNEFKEYPKETYQAMEKGIMFPFKSETETKQSGIVPKVNRQTLYNDANTLKVNKLPLNAAAVPKVNKLFNDANVLKEGGNIKYDQMVPPAAKTVGFRDTLTNNGYTNITYHPDTAGVTATKGNMTYYFTPDGLTNNNGTLIGTDEQIAKVMGNPMKQVRQTGADAGVYVGYDKNGNPTYNGQLLDTTGMVKIDDKWYGSGDYLENMAKSVTHKYEDPYKEKRDDLLNRLLNYNKFDYNAEEDERLAEAMELARRAAMRNAVDRGVGGSSIAEYAAAAAANDLIPQYEDKAYQRYLAERDYLGQLMGYLNNAADYDLRTYDVNNSNRISERDFAADQQTNNDILRFDIDKHEYEKGRDLIEDELIREAQENEIYDKAYERAMEKFLTLGEVTEDTAAILGLPVGTTTLEYKLALDKLYKPTTTKTTDTTSTAGNGSGEDNIFSGATFDVSGWN